MTDVFIKKSEKAEPGFNVGIILRRNETKGDIGIEIEAEGNKFPKAESLVPSPWVYHEDGSLRGKDNAEYVLRSPIAFKEVPQAITDLWAAMNAYGTVLDDSNRTSVHIHLNCQQFHLNRLTSLMALYFTFEEVLTAWCGEHRVGNLFCLRAKDAPAIVSQIRRFIKTDGQTELRDHLHYAGLNANALQKFGSLEFRSLRGCTDPQVILDWVSILQRLYELSAEYKDPRDICGLFSAEGPLSFFESILGEQAATVRNGVNMTHDQIADSMYEGIRMAQDICYCRDWALFSAMDVKKDPFGRDMKKMAKKIIGAMTGASAASNQGLNFEPEYDQPQLQVTPSQTYSPTPPTFYGDPFPTSSFNTPPTAPPPLSQSDVDFLAQLAAVMPQEEEPDWGD